MGWSKNGPENVYGQNGPIKTNGVMLLIVMTIGEG